jgi:ATPase
MFVRISKYDRSLVNKQKSLDKYYCIDNGLRGAVLMPQSDENGKKLENTVFMQLNRMKLHSDKIYYYQGDSKCNFLLHRSDRVVRLIQVTWDMAYENTHERQEFTGILEASLAIGCNNQLIVTKEEEATIVHEGKQINVMPA